MSCWYVDMLNQIIGETPSRVLVLDGRGASGRMQPTSIGIYDYHGVWGILKMDVNRPDEVSIQVELSGSEGNATLDYFTGILTRQSRRNPERIDEEVFPLRPYADYPAVRETVSAFLDAVIHGDCSHGNAAKVAALNRVGLAAEASKDSGNWVTI